ncbi:leucine-rich repeats and immunoglobulin-like domains protein 1 [Sinocyclocheilus grahami]|uniref:leucine-rich repeats and immunoglobulin-like domains protein 1 n=1 Tax=Sinocyclocheilus grahami TaxID=75366 RepID=UPI0007AC6902|nr:PREDICTED: leucine-rich repeats and immunoglobulin-like domains protein 1 [Sinocyclocheilus grahami]
MVHVSCDVVGNQIEIWLVLMSFLHAGLTHDKPQPTLSVKPQSSVFTGDTVTLSCDVGQLTGWTINWRKDSNPESTGDATKTIKSVSVSDGGVYKCIAERGNSYSEYSNAVTITVKGTQSQAPTYSQMSDGVTLTVSDKPQLTLTVKPQSSVFTGDTVTLSCDVGQLTGWTIHWRKDSNPESTALTDKLQPTLTVKPQSSVFTGDTVTLSCDVGQLTGWTIHWRKDSNPESTGDATKTIKSVRVSDEGEYKCRAERGNSYSEYSNAVTITVKDLSRSTLTVTPDSPVFTGETVTLKCVIESHSNWRYEWYKGTDSVMLQTSDRYTVNRDTLTIRRVITSDQDQYTCRGQRDKRPNSSQSSSVSLSVTDLPRSTLTVTPDSPVFTGETVTLKCVIESYSYWRRRNGQTQDWRYDWTPEWRYEWNKGRDSVKLQTSDRYTVNRDTLTIRGVITADQEYYTCRGQISLWRNYSPRSTLTVTPDSPVFTGETVTLKCESESYSNWRYEWNKGTNNSVMLQTSERYTVNRDTLTIRGVITADQDQYWCRGQRDKRPKSSQESKRIHLSVNGE